ncbi:MAG: DNA topology modulation protein FlaR [Oscillospiraceae bacterium]|nr:DNA topology modulation protein FlaR [Oscillospiraceae bacterium]
MKISILGYSGAGKSTLARQLGELYNIPVLHLDTVQYKPDWQERERPEKEQIVADFLDKNTSWVIDGTYSGLHFKRRLEESDLIIMLLFNRFVCFGRVLKRYRSFKGSTRPDMADGCAEKLDREFARWVLFDGRTAKRREKFKRAALEFPEKTAVIKNKRQLKKFLKELPDHL